MSPRACRACAGAAASLLLASCASSPTGRAQLRLLPPEQVARMGDEAFAELRAGQPAEADTPASRFIDCVARAVIAIVPQPRGGGTWTVAVFASDQVNAFALPGGNIGVYTGLLKAARTPAELAAVIGHEVAHVQAEHANARLSGEMAADAGLSAIQALGRGTVLENRQAMALLGLGAQVGVLLPFSRAQEREADLLGLGYMARAGFDPQASVQLWRNMAALPGAAVPDFLSTHPSGDERIQALQEAMPQALEAYRQALAQGRRPDCPAP